MRRQAPRSSVSAGSAAGTRRSEGVHSRSSTRNPHLRRPHAAQGTDSALGTYRAVYDLNSSERTNIFIHICLYTQLTHRLAGASQRLSCRVLSGGEAAGFSLSCDGLAGERQISVSVTRLSGGFLLPGLVG